MRGSDERGKVVFRAAKKNDSVLSGEVYVSGKEERWVGRFEVVVVMCLTESSEWQYARKHGGAAVL